MALRAHLIHYGAVENVGSKYMQIFEPRAREVVSYNYLVGGDLFYIKSLYQIPRGLFQ